MLLIGLTGGIASGKSLVQDMFKNLSVPVIDADDLAREVVAPGSDGLTTLVEYFSDAILQPNGELNRSALRKIVFSDSDHRRFLDRTLHPRIRTLSEKYIGMAQSQEHAYLVYAVPLLFETKQQERFDKIIVVDVPRSMQLSRVLARDSSSPQQAESILAAQANRDERLAIADYIIDNSGSIQNTHKQVVLIDEAIRELL